MELNLTLTHRMVCTTEEYIDPLHRPSTGVTRVEYHAKKVGTEVKRATVGTSPPEGPETSLNADRSLPSNVHALVLAARKPLRNHRTRTSHPTLTDNVNTDL